MEVCLCSAAGQVLSRKLRPALFCNRSDCSLGTVSVHSADEDVSVPIPLVQHGGLFAPLFRGCWWFTQSPPAAAGIAASDIYPMRRTGGTKQPIDFFAILQFTVVDAERGVRLFRNLQPFP